jgi:hypothetical protein
MSTLLNSANHARKPSAFLGGRGQGTNGSLDIPLPSIVNVP